MAAVSDKEDIYIAVVGAGFCDEETCEAARAVGELIAGNGAILVCGGLGGVMDAAAEGARKVGGTAVGILPGKSKRGSSSHLTIAIPTGMGEGRNAMIVKAVDGLIAIGGEYGTLSEIALALKVGKPVVGLHTWKATSSKGKDAEVITAASPREAVEKLFSLL